MRQEGAALLRLETDLFGRRAMVQACFPKELRQRTESGALQETFLLKSPWGQEAESELGAKL